MSKRTGMRLTLGWLVVGLAFAAVASPGLAEDPATPPPNAAAASPAADHAAAIKATLQKDQAALKQYEWIETTVISMKGDEKSRVQNKCYYGADGKVQKTAMGEAPAEEKSKRGVRGKVVESKKEEITDYMSRTAAAIKTYIPPDPAKLQAAQAAGKVAVEVLEPNKRVRVNFKDYNVPGDLLSVELDVATNHILAMNVQTTVQGGKEPVSFQTAFSALPDGTGYPAKTTLDAKEVNMLVVVENSGHRKAGSS